MSATRPILIAVRDYLAAELPAYTVELFPDDPAGYRFMAPLGAVLVGYQGSKFCPSGRPRPNRPAARRHTGTDRVRARPEP